MGAFFVSGFWLPSLWAFCPAPGPLPQVQVQRVVDGDTLRLRDGRSVRLIGINAPELARQGRGAEPLAEAARRRLQALVEASGGTVGLRVGRRGKDHYGRTLAHVYGRSGLSFEAQLLGEGLGYHVVFPPDTALAVCQATAERHARLQRLGLWRKSPVRQSRQVNKSGFALVGGKVLDVRRNSGGVWIELDSLVLRIAPNHLRHFDAAWWRNLKGRRIEARGWVVERARQGGLQSGQARWMLPVTHPAMLKLAN